MVKNLPISGPQSQRRAEPERWRPRNAREAVRGSEMSHVNEQRGLMERKQNCLVTVWSAVHAFPPSVTMLLFLCLSSTRRDSDSDLLHEAVLVA